MVQRLLILLPFEDGETHIAKSSSLTDIVAETVNENIPSQPLITEAEVQEILNNEEEEISSTIAVEVSEEVTDTQAAVVAPPEPSPTTAVQQGTPSLN